MQAMTVRYSDNTATRLTLERGQVASTKEARGLAVECVRGSLWITFEDGGADFVLEPGERIPVKAGGRMVIEAMAASELMFFSLAPAVKPEVHVGGRNVGCSPDGWRTFVSGVALPRANFDSAF